VKIKKALTNLPIPRSLRDETFEQEQERELETEVEREILGLDNRARREHNEQ
jgi:hypothetical protein